MIIIILIIIIVVVIIIIIIIIIIKIIYHQDLHHHPRHHHLNKTIFFQSSFPPQQTTLKQNFFGSAPRIPPTPSVLLLPPDNYFLINTKFGENVIEKPEKVTENIDNALNKVPVPLEIGLGNSLINVLSTKADETLQDHYIYDNVPNEKTIEEIKDEYNFDQIKDTFDKGKVSPQLKFFFGGDNENFVNPCKLIGLGEDNNEFVCYFCSDMGQNMMTDNSLSVHIKRGDIFYGNCNSNENFYNFLVVQQDETKQFIPKRISHHHSFERYMKLFLPAFSLEEDEKYDLLTNKNSKHLLYKLKNWIESLNAEKIKIRHSSKVKDDIGLIKMEEKDNQFLIEKIIGAVEKNSPYKISM